MHDHPSLSWMHGVDLTALDAAHLHQVKRCLLDLLGVAAGATRTSLAEKARRFVTTQHGGDRPLLFANGQASPTGVALHGAWLIDALDAHDGQVLTKGHAGVALLPGLLALPEVNRLSGHDFLALLAYGYEIATRAGIALHATSPDYHTSGAWNALGVAAVAARLRGVDVETMHHALGIAEFYGPRSQMMRCIDHPTMLKDGSGWGAMTGISAALLAEDGFTGAPALTVTAPDVTMVWQDLGERWYLHEQYFKAYPVCRWAQPAVEAVLSLPAAKRDPAAITRIEIITFHEGKRLHVMHPTTTEQAQYSLPWSVACALGRGTVDVAGVCDELDAPDLKALASQVEIHEDDNFNARFPAERWACARLHLSNGEVIESANFEARGNPDQPLSDAELIEKYQTLAKPVLGDRATRIHEVVMSLDTRPAGDLLALLGEP
ncbi:MULTISPECIES: MmgE/PrpD family protein [Halomonadaceae]|uniref:MmgE/PrpD family protein n=1 Tax=Vreelandella janggokensis TaxID=370767 RepID=A0ABT4IQ60_9GAMM|nr:MULTISPECIES: MmgE/PrpD family protein [Halomonas]MCZ0925683.1 MmgE/PrpD family protein [Halomonas janggokensis]MDR5886808.1 MmgE/PrpD family protein [Halomonas janggokensis]QPL47294.1 MmgE/PrpD family protein [Halomonas sp. A40-4]